MRMAPVIIVLAAIAVSLVHIRRQQTSFAHEIQRMRNRQVSLRRKLWEQQAKLGFLSSPSRIQRELDSYSGPLAIPGGSPSIDDQAGPDSEAESAR